MKYLSEITVAFECQYHSFPPGAIPQIPLYPDDALWMQLLVDLENISNQSEKNSSNGGGIWESK